MVKHPDALDKITKARLFFSTLGSIFSIALTMFVIGIIFFIAYFTQNYIKNFSSKIEFEILFYPEVRDADIITFEQTLKLASFISTSRVSSKEKNTEEVIRILGNNYTETISNPINTSIIFTIDSKYTDTDSLNTICRNIKENSIVKDVQYPSYMLSVFKSGKIYQIIILIICLVFIFISMLFITNSLRLSIYAKRFNIKSMLLIGATRRYIRRPFIMQGLVHGVCGGGISVFCVVFLFYYMNYYFEKNDFLSGVIDFSNTLHISFILASIFLFSIIFTITVSLISVNKYIKMKSDIFYL